MEDLAKGQGADGVKVVAKFFRTVRPTSLVKRFAMPEEKTAIVVYACKLRASVMNGAALRVDGGVVWSIV